MPYTLRFSKPAQKEAAKIKAANLSKKVKELLDVLRVNPFQNPPAYEKLIGDLKGIYSRRINLQHRLTYKVDEENKIVYILRMWTHYD